MGGLPSMLLMIAAAGITYGWQPDSSGDNTDDIEYIVQVSPTELANLQSSGSGGLPEVSSVIDPEVKGRVSRVVLRVGAGDLPRKLPSDRSTKRVATLKPDPQGGFGLPSSLQDTANDSANQFGNQAVDRAGRTIQDGVDQAKQQANNLLDRLRANSADGSSAGRSLVPPPSTRPSTSPRTPSLGSSSLGSSSLGSSARENSANSNTSSGLFAQARTGGPSTSPIGQNSQTGRDNQWGPFSTQQRMPQQQANQQPGARRNPQTSLASNGLRSSDMFGRMPESLQNRDTDQSSFADRDDRDSLSNNTNGNSGIYSQVDQTQRDFEYGLRNRQESDRSNTSSQVARSTQTGGYLANSRPNPKLSSDQLAAGGWDLDDYNRLVDRNGQLIRDLNSQIPFADRTTGGLAGISGRSRNTNPQTVRNRDAWGRPIDNTSDRDALQRNQNTYGRTAQGSIDARSQDLRYSDPNLAYSDRNSPDPRYASREVGSYPTSSLPPMQSRTADQRTVDQRMQTQQRMPDLRVADQRVTDQRTIAQRTPAPRTTEYDVDRNGGDYLAQSPSDRISQSGIGAGSIKTESLGGMTRTKQVAAQPLFNGLLLISIVANLYLIFWLKNLRVQFKDMVAAKRLASSSASVA